MKTHKEDAVKSFAIDEFPVMKESEIENLICRDLVLKIRNGFLAVAAGDSHSCAKRCYDGDGENDRWYLDTDASIHDVVNEYSSETIY